MSVEGPTPEVLVLHPSGPDAPPCPGAGCFLSVLLFLGRTLCLHPQEKEMNSWDCPGDQLVLNPSSSAGDVGSIPSQET